MRWPKPPKKYEYDHVLVCMTFVTASIGEVAYY
jgi:hypothetical protein